MTPPIEITLSIQQLAGKLPLYIKGRKYWLVNEKQRRDQLKLKSEARANTETLQKLVNLNRERR